MSSITERTTVSCRGMAHYACSDKEIIQLSFRHSQLMSTRLKTFAIISPSTSLYCTPVSESENDVSSTVQETDEVNVLIRQRSCCRIFEVRVGLKFNKFLEAYNMITLKAAYFEFVYTSLTLSTLSSIKLFLSIANKN